MNGPYTSVAQLHNFNRQFFKIDPKNSTNCLIIKLTLPCAWVNLTTFVTYEFRNYSSDSNEMLSICLAHLKTYL